MNDLIACAVDNANPFPAININNAALLSKVESYQLYQDRLEQAIKLADLHCEKYAFVPNTTKEIYGHTLMRIVAAKDINDDVKKGDFGGWIEKRENLSDQGKCWVYSNACVFEDAKVTDWAEVYGKAKVYENATISGRAQICGSAKVYGNAKVYGDVVISGCANIGNHADISGAAPASSTDKVAVLITDNASIGDQSRICGTKLVIRGNSEVTHRASITGSVLLDNSRVRNTASIGGASKVVNSAIMNDAKVYHNATIKNSTIHDRAAIYGDAIVTDSRVYDDAVITDHAKVYNDAKIVRNAFIYGNAEVYGCEFDGKVGELDPAISKARQTDTVKKLKYKGMSVHDDSLNTDDNDRFLRYIFEQDYINKTVKFDSDRAAGIYIACDDNTLAPENRPSPMYITSQVLDRDNVIVTIHSTKLDQNAAYCFQNNEMSNGRMKIIPMATNSRSFEVLWELRNLLEWKDPGPKEENNK